MIINIAISDEQNLKEDLQVRINGKKVVNKSTETVEEVYDRKVKRSKASHHNRWEINEDNCHLVGFNKREFNRFTAIPFVAVFLDEDGAIKREEFFELLKRMPQLYAEASDGFNGGWLLNH